MKFSSSLEPLKKSIDKVSRLIDSNPTLPVLNNILLETSGKRLTLIATNLESAIRYSLEVKVINEGKATVPAKIFSNYISFLKDEKVELEATGEDLLIKSNSSKTKIKGLPVSEFPLLPEVEKNISFKLKSTDLINALEETTFICQNNSTRAVLSGVYFYYESGFINIVSTDGYRLSEKKIPYKENKENLSKLSVIIPVRTLQEVQKNLSLSPEVEIILNQNQVLFRFGEVELFSRLVKGDFPSYQAIIPKEENTLVTLSTAELLSAVQQMSVLARSDNNSLKINITTSNVKIVSSSSQVGEGETTLSAKVTGPEQNINLNVDFLLAALNIFKSEKVQFKLKDKTSPIIFTDPSEENFLHLIMPLKS